MMLVMTKNKSRISAYRYWYIWQGVVLIGIRTPTFMNTAEAVQDIHSCFDRQFQEGALKDLQGPKHVNQLSMSNRYFMLACEANEMQAVAFLPGVDPTKILHGMAQEDSSCTYIHMEDNQVHYYKTHRDKAGVIRSVSSAINHVRNWWIIYRYKRCEPQVFRVGDIIEAQVSFIAILIKGGQRKMLTVLWSLALIKANFKKVCTSVTRPSTWLGTDMDHIR